MKIFIYHYDNSKCNFIYEIVCNTLNKYKLHYTCCKSSNINTISDIYNLYILYIDDNSNFIFDICFKILLSNSNVNFIFIAASNKYAELAYHVKAIRYFIEPFPYDYFSNELVKVIDFLYHQQTYIYLNNYPATKIYVSSILYLETYNRKIAIHTENSIYFTNKTIKYWYNYLKNFNFFISYKGILINLNKIKNIKRYELTLYNDEKLPISRTKYKELINNLKIINKNKRF